VRGFELYRNEHDPCGKRAKGTVLIRETHPPKTKNQRLTEGRRRRRRRGNTWRTEKCAENETGLKEAIAMASKTFALLFCRPLFSLSLSLSTHPQTTPNLSSLRGSSETGLGRIRVRGRGEGDDVRVSRWV